LPAIFSTVSFSDFPIRRSAGTDIDPSGNANLQATESLSGVVGVTVPGGGISKRFATLPASVVDLGLGMAVERLASWAGGNSGACSKASPENLTVPTKPG
jgi:hypothetical protein